MPFVQLPKHFRNLKARDLRIETLRFKLRFAALMTMPTGSMQELAASIGVSPSGLSQMIREGYVPGEMCVKLEQVCGKNEFPRQWFNPELYSTVGA